MSEHLKRIYADYDDQGIWVYQAFEPTTVHEAVRLGTFGKGFGLNRMTWIKPSLGWMLYRSGYATKERQQAIARIKLKHEGFQAILKQGIPSAHDPQLFDSEIAWGDALHRSEVRYQWDPERDLRLHKLERRAIQIGLSGQTVLRYVKEWIMGIEDITTLAHSIRDAVERREKILPIAPIEKEYSISPELQKIMGYD